jgi:hypothetical protein
VAGDKAMTNSPSESTRKYYEIDKAFYDLFYKAFESGEDIVLQRQLEDDPAAKHRYADRCIKEAKNLVADLIDTQVREAREGLWIYIQSLYSDDGDFDFVKFTIDNELKDIGKSNG